MPPRWDLRWASIMLKPPRIPCIWVLSEAVLAASCRFVQSTAVKPPGRAFGEAPYSHLPESFRALLQLIATLTTVMEDFTPSDDCGYREFLDLRSAAHYQLLLVPSWLALKQQPIDTATAVVYECCRLTSILFSNAVLLCLPPRIGWAESLLPGLRILLDSNMPDMFPSLRLWALMLGGIASQDSVHQAFFESSLRQAFATQPAMSWVDMEDVLGNFMWSRKVCGRGAALLWEKCRPH